MEHVAELISEAEYLSTVYEPDAEFVDGVIEERSVGNKDHAKWQVALAYFFSLKAVEWDLLVRTELRNKIGERRYRIPDVALYDSNIAEEPVPVHPALIVFEIVSPDDRHANLMTRLADFEAMGVRAIYLVYPETGRFSRFQGAQLSPVDTVTFPKNWIGDRERTVLVKEIAALVR